MITKEQYERLSQKERKIFAHVQRERDKVGYMNIRELAASCGVSTATVVRFLQKIGFSSYKEFKFWCRNVQKEAHPPQYHMGEIIDCLHKLYTPFFQEKIEEAAEMILSTHMTVLLGVGNSAGIAQYGAHCLSNYGVFAISMGDLYQDFSQWPTEISVIVCSVSGENLLLVEVLEQIVQREAVVICITTNADSTLAAMSDLALAYYLNCGHDEGKTDLSSQLPAVAVLEQLAQSIYQKKLKPEYAHEK